MKNELKLWNKNFLLLWQGTLFSSLGNVAYSIALGFWVLEKTGSTLVMGALMAVTTIPSIIVGPIAGVIIDRGNRKFILVITDVISGFFVCFVGINMLLGTAEVWMVFMVGIILGLSKAFFLPASASIMPDIIPKDDIEKGNSFYSMIGSSTRIIGNSVGGVLYKILGAPVMFLINGISYFISAISELFIDVPKINKKSDLTFYKELKEGLKYTWNFKGLRKLLLIFSVVNFLQVLF